MDSICQKPSTGDFEFYRDKAELSVAQLLFEGIVNHTHDLPAHPLKGQIESLLVDRTQEFRYLVFKNYKIIYWINTPKNRIDIVHVFDTRQNPTKLHKLA